ncbi:hypothetical protein J4Q44_G00017560 [Coregonus suidteri]|uniref:Uncharacterized protein n=1 Tax=Coregonus suidteri TaxID=861788 RepID=A0AAN8MGA7_9TELE
MQPVSSSDFCSKLHTDWTKGSYCFQKTMASTASFKGTGLLFFLLLGLQPSSFVFRTKHNLKFLFNHQCCNPRSLQQQL